jgi:GT2 family glycosyltransferase
MTRVTIVIVSHNSGELLLDCVASALSSTIPVRVVIADNNSTDGTIEKVLERYGARPELIVLRCERNLGFATAVNRALTECQGDFLLLLNPDCKIKPDTLARMIAVMDDNPSTGLSGCLIRNPDGSEQAGCRRYVPTPWRTLIRVSHIDRFISHPRLRSFNMLSEPLPKGVMEVEAISGAFMFVRRSVMEEVGPLDDKYFLHCEDLDWCMRFRAAGHRVLFVPFVEIVHDQGSSSRGRPVFVEWHKHRGMIRFYRKFFRHQYPGALMLAVISAVWIRFVAKAMLLSVCNLIRR